MTETTAQAPPENDQEPDESALHQQVSPYGAGRAAEKEKRQFLEARDDLQYLPVGILSKIADAVGCQRQYVHQVVYAKTPFLEMTHKAVRIWRLLYNLVYAVESPENVRAKHMEELERNKGFFKALREGTVVQVQMPSRKFRFFERKLEKLGIPCSIYRQPTAPITYTFVPDNASDEDKEKAAQASTDE